MKQDLVQFLPSEIAINIFSRLHVRTIAMSKCVCYPWLDLLETDDFVNSYLSKSVPALAVLEEEEEELSIWWKVFEFKDEDDDVERRYNPLILFDFPHRTVLVDAADGLLLLLENFRTLYVCNPITGEYVELRGVVVDQRSIYGFGESIYGFGASKITREHKAVQIIQKSRPDSRCKCQVNVYTLETGSLRRFEDTVELNYNDIYGAFVNGNLHWLSEKIDCFDLETERFSMFSAPPLDENRYITSICALKDCLCVCAAMPSEDYDFVIDIWLMKEYGVENSWTKEYVIGLYSNYAVDMCSRFYPINVFENGDILISGGNLGCELLHFSDETHTVHEIGMLRPARGTYLAAWLLTPSLLSLKRNLGMRNVLSF